MRKRPESEGRLLARKIPDDARVVALVYVPEEGGRGPRTAEAVATALARRREHTLLAPLGPLPEALRASLGEAPMGLYDALEGRAGLTEVARRPGARPFVYLPAGEDPPEPAAMVRHAAFGDFASRVRRRGGTLLLLVPAAALEAAAATGVLDGYLALGAGVPGEVEGAPELGRVGPPEEAGPGADEAAPESRLPGRPTPGEGAPGAADAAVRPSRPPDAGPTSASPEPEPSEPSGHRPDWRPGEPPGVARVENGGEPSAAADRDEGSGSWRRYRAESRLPLLQIGIGALVVLGLAAGWWLFARESGSSGASGPTSAGLASPADEGGSPPATAPDPELLRLTVEEAPELPYSVLIASYASRADADERLAALEEAGGGPFFVAPTPVRGAVYWRVFAGARPAAEAGRALMESLVERGLKDQAGGWDVRPVRLAYLLAVHGRRSAAQRTADSARVDGIPAYVIAAGAAEGDTAYALYAGAYESAEAALPMEQMLDRTGRRAELVPRRGSTP